MQILVVVVRYKTLLEESQTMKSLESAVRDAPALFDEVAVLVWDNSPAALQEPRTIFPFEYIHSKKNRGVSGAYNEAMTMAEKMHCDWMLLLDQDTILPTGFVEKMLEYSRTLDRDVDIAAVIPTVWVNSQYISPRRVCFNHSEACNPSLSGVPDGECTAANSGVLMRVSALREIGGYSEDFSLDFSDMYVFHQLHRKGKKVWIAGDLKLDHRMTNFEYDGDLTPERYVNFMEAEDAFISNYKSTLENIVQTVRLLARSLKQYSRYSNGAYARISLRFFWRRLLYSRSVREQAWKAKNLAR